MYNCVCYLPSSWPFKPLIVSLKTDRFHKIMWNDWGSLKAALLDKTTTLKNIFEKKKKTHRSGRMWRGRSGWSAPLCFVGGAGLQCVGRAATLLWWPRLWRRELRLRTWWSAWTPTSPLLPSSSICSPSSHGQQAERQRRRGRGRGLTESKRVEARTSPNS